ncbi:hypothetical protein ADK59_13830 [Streptomyces sp. XY332]|nr:hypothetical protein VR46_05055 [Streptomyces sp. NRRL S-444]KOY57335.1 hypothetical protein ADK59_13830 [Streptomyces sp. XY332]
MSVAVARTDGDDREPGPDLRLQAGVLVCGAVVGDLEDVDRAQLRMGRQKCLLRRRFEIS